MPPIVPGTRQMPRKWSCEEKGVGAAITLVPLEWGEGAPATSPPWTQFKCLKWGRIWQYQKWLSLFAVWLNQGYHSASKKRGGGPPHLQRTEKEGNSRGLTC